MGTDSEDYGEGVSPGVMFNPSPISHRPDRLALGVAVAALWLAGVSAGASEAIVLGYPRITYTKVLHGSTPEFISITVDRLGNTIYEAGNVNDPASPRTLQLKDVTTQKVFELAGALNNFDEVDLERGLGRELRGGLPGRRQSLIETFQAHLKVDQEVPAPP